MTMQPENQMLVPRAPGARATYAARVLSLAHYIHIIVENRLLIAVLPLDGDTGPIRLDAYAGVLGVTAPDHADANKRRTQFSTCHALHGICIG